MIAEGGASITTHLPSHRPLFSSSKPFLCSHRVSNDAICSLFKSDMAKMRIAMDANVGEMNHARMAAIFVDQIDKFLSHDDSSLPDFNVRIGRWRLARDGEIVAPYDFNRNFRQL
jgi:hypothetical protein